MPCIPIKGGFVCVSGGPYRYKGFRFYYRDYLGFIKINKDGVAAKREGMKFWLAMDEWIHLPIEEREAYRVEI